MMSHASKFSVVCYTVRQMMVFVTICLTFCPIINSYNTKNNIIVYHIVQWKNNIIVNHTIFSNGKVKLFLQENYPKNTAQN